MLSCSRGNGIEFSCSDEHVKHLTQRFSHSIPQPQSKVDSNEMNEFKEGARPVHSPAESSNDETNFIIQMPGATPTKTQ